MQTIDSLQSEDDCSVVNIGIVPAINTIGVLKFHGPFVIDQCHDLALGNVVAATAVVQAGKAATLATEST